jgi:uncharacterized protein
MTTPTSIAQRYIRAVQTGDQAALAELLSAQIVWHQPGANRFSGLHVGLPAVLGMIGGMMEVSRGSFAITQAKRFMANGDWIAVELTFEARREGAHLLQDGIDLLRIEAGRIVEARLFSSDLAEEDRFWGH